MPKKKKEVEEIDAIIYEKKEKKKSTQVNHEKETIEEATIVHDSNFQKPYFLPRLIAYIIDIMLVSIVCTGILFLIPENKNYDKYMQEYKQIQTDLIEEKIDVNEYFNKSIDIVYDIDYSNVLPMIIEVVLIILYFVVFQFYNKGQTFGKKLMKLRVISIRDGDLTINQVAYRALIINSILVNILILGSLLFLGRSYYFYANYVLQLLSIIIVFVTLLMILFRKDGRGLHDVIAGTKVIQEN